MVDSLRNKRIVMIPTGSANSLNLQTLDLNDILRRMGLHWSASAFRRGKSPQRADAPDSIRAPVPSPGEPTLRAGP